MDLFPSTASSSSPASSAPEQRRQCYGLGSAACGLAGRVLCGMVTCVFAAGSYVGERIHRSEFLFRISHYHPFHD
ncbi:hypothetical protein EJB05_38195, partial [Eragrostis curvula]